jgi:hypothetical protein
MWSHRVSCFWFAQLHQKAWAYVEHQIEKAGRSAVRTVRAAGPDGPRAQNQLGFRVSATIVG